MTRAGGGIDEQPVGANASEPVLHSAALSFVAAYVDTACFIGLFGLFTAHVTGNFVLIGAALVDGRGAVAAKLLALPVFALAVAATAWAGGALRSRGRDAIAPLLSLQSLLLGVAATTSLATSAVPAAEDHAAIAMGMSAVAAMGVQNALMRLEWPGLPPSTVMTGNVTQLVIDLSRLRSGADIAVRAAARASVVRLLPGIAAFTLGAAAGAWAFAAMGLRSLAVPTLLCAALAWRLRGRNGRAP